MNVPEIDTESTVEMDKIDDVSLGELGDYKSVENYFKEKAAEDNKLDLEYNKVKELLMMDNTFEDAKQEDKPFNFVDLNIQDDDSDERRLMEDDIDLHKINGASATMLNFDDQDREYQYLKHKEKIEKLKIPLTLEEQIDDMHRQNDLMELDQDYEYINLKDEISRQIELTKQRNKNVDQFVAENINLNLDDV
jgi:hypothetical protein